MDAGEGGDLRGRGCSSSSRKAGVVEPAVEGGAGDIGVAGGLAEVGGVGDDGESDELAWSETGSPLLCLIMSQSVPLCLEIGVESGAGAGIGFGVDDRCSGLAGGVGLFGSWDVSGASVAGLDLARALALTLAVSAPGCAMDSW